MSGSSSTNIINQELINQSTVIVNQLQSSSDDEPATSTSESNFTACSSQSMSSSSTPSSLLQNVSSCTVKPKCESIPMLETIESTNCTTNGQSVFIKMTTTNNVPVDVPGDELMLVSTITNPQSEDLVNQYQPYYPYFSYETNGIFPTSADDYGINSEHHFYCYSHMSPPSTDQNASFFDDVFDPRLHTTSMTNINRSERRVGFVDIVRRRSRLLSLRRRSRSRSRTEETNDSSEEDDIDEEIEDEEEDVEDETGFSDQQRNRRESDLLRFIRSTRSRSPSFNSFRECKRSQMHRVSLLGRPIHCRPTKHVNPRYRHYQNEMHNFLERPRGWKAMIYHIVM
ncbi:hypothetical protein RDWZM_000004 [Blomia tropicalis]|uniref:Uncharacterized protein n=1 Tax=Blomia tropicalis TaxID=40697 RepID=A0A9Q0M9L6_BLOTA|nr:hypothetical protein RDWZM_000004 [Blomia tropicalis]